MIQGDFQGPNWLDLQRLHHNPMQNNLHPDGAPKSMTRDSGAVYRIDGNGRVSQLTPREFGITNTMAWTDDWRFLTADTTRNAIYAYDLRAGVLSNKRVFAPPIDRGAPDGLCLDVKGRLWNCRVAGGACVACIRPDGALIDSSTCPARRRPVALSVGPISPRSM